MKGYPILSEARRLLLAGDHWQAEQVVLKSLTVEGATPLSLFYLGEILCRINGRTEDGLAALARAVKSAPKQPGFRLSYALKLLEVFRFNEALVEFDAALALNPDVTLANTWSIRLHRRFQTNADSVLEESKIRRLLAHENSPDLLVLLSLIDNADELKVRATRVGAAFDRTPLSVPLVEGASRAKIRVGYVSGDVREHATMQLMRDMFTEHDQERFEFYFYDLNPHPDSPWQKRIKSFARVYRPFDRYETRALAETIRRDELDIIIDLKGYTRDSDMGIFAHRVAPVQIAFLGYPGTTGIAEMDYLVADERVVPACAQRFYSEKILYMPDCYQVNACFDGAPPAWGTRRDHGLPDSALVLASFNHPQKVSAAQFDVWAKILTQLPEAVLWFYSGQDPVETSLRERMLRHDLDPERLITCPIVPNREHLGRMSLADICLDSFPYNAHTTASDAVRTAVPIVTRRGQQFASRVAASILETVGVPELVVETDEEYIALVCDLARSCERRAELRARLQGNAARTSLFDSHRYTAQFEQLLTKAHERRVAGLAPDHLSLAQEQPGPAVRVTAA